MRVWPLLVSALLAACGGPAPSEHARDAGPECIAAGADAFCDAAHPCCDGALCDPASRCRAPDSCGQDGAGCTAELACCGGLSCINDRCTLPAAQDLSATGGGGAAGGGAAGATGGTGLPGPGNGGLSGAPTLSSGGGTGDPGPEAERGGYGAPHPL